MDNYPMAQLENFRLKVFRAVAEHLNFHQAAEQLFLTQPAVTLQVKALENDIGARLFDRAAGRISLTRQGSALLDYAIKIAALVSQAERELSAGGGSVSGELSVGASTTIAQYVLPRLLGAFLAEYPGVQFSLHTGNTREIVRLVLGGKLCAGLIEGPARDRGVRPEHFLEDELVLVTPRDMDTGRLSRKQFLGLCLLLREQGSGSRRVVETELEKASFKLRAFKKVMELDSTEAIKSAVEAGLGVGFVSNWAISKELELGSLKVARVNGLRVTRHFTLISRTGPEPQGPPGALRAFILGRAHLISDTPRRSLRPDSASR